MSNQPQPDLRQRMAVRKAIVASMESQCSFKHVGLIGAHLSWDKVAQAAIDALGLTREHRMEWTDSLGVVRATAPTSHAGAQRYVAEAQQNQPDTDARTTSRCVTEWVPDA